MPLAEAMSDTKYFNPRLRVGLNLENLLDLFGLKTP